jgi:pyruvate/2-oxoglutarate dehydrogenase complex dihydrolipoamide dehydrogenase (E3) component
MNKKVLVIGAGPGGYVAAIRTAQLGGEVTVVEKAEVGGTCLNWGCIPTKSLLQSAKLYQAVQETRKFGVYCSDWSFRYDKMVEAKNRIVRTQVNGIKSLFRKNKIRFIKGSGRLLDDRTETNVPGIYAIGDVTGTLLLAHWASAQGVVAAENALGQSTRLDAHSVPSCIFTIPEIASVGLSEEQARKKGIAVKTAKMTLRFNGMANAMMETDGFIKVVVDEKEGQVIGVHIIGPHASDLISEGTVAVKKKMALSEMKEIIHAHPTLSETMQEAIFSSAGGGAIHAV